MNRTAAILAVAFTCVVMGALIGALTNMVNGAVSPLYFRNIMGWHDVQDVWRASVAQGILEGLVHGVLFAAVFTTVFGIVTRGECTYLHALRFMFGVSVAVIVCWVLGGVVAVGLAALSPEFYRRAFIGVPEESGAMLRYAWGGGSIWGGMFGGLLGAIIGSTIFRINWKRREAKRAGGTTS